MKPFWEYSGLITFIHISILITIAVLLFLPKLREDRTLHDGEHLTQKGKRNIGLNFIIIALTISQFFLNNSSQNYAQEQAELKQNQRDSVLSATYKESLKEMQDSYEEGNRETMNSIVSSLAEYNYQLDSTNKKLLQVIKDSAKTTVIREIEPTLMLKHEEQIYLYQEKDSTSIYQYILVSYDAPSSNVSLSSTGLFEDENGTYILNHKNTEFLNDFPKNGSQTLNLMLQNKYCNKYYYLRIKGTYTNKLETQKYDFFEIYRYNFTSKTTVRIVKESKIYLDNLMNNIENLIN